MIAKVIEIVGTVQKYIINLKTYIFFSDCGRNRVLDNCYWKCQPQCISAKKVSQTFQSSQMKLWPKITLLSHPSFLFPIIKGSFKFVPS